MWPLLTLHLAWEKRNFVPDNDGLYDAYACIWASDALYYNSGAVTHSSAYNYRGNKLPVSTDFLTFALPVSAGTGSGFEKQTVTQHTTN